jgi:ADP-ribose pyrophosphatase YjhB (NUDIX family)
MTDPGKPPEKLQGPITRMVPPGDNRERMVCADCGFVDYQNPKIVVGVVARWEGRVLMCRRAIEPRRGLWTIPAGYLELHESAEAGALREAREEANAEVRLTGLIGVYNVPRISQVQLIYRGELVHPEVSAGEESLEVALFDWHEIPRREIAFPSVHWALDDWRQVRDLPEFATRTNPVGDTGNFPTR